MRRVLCRRAELSCSSWPAMQTWDIPHTQACCCYYMLLHPPPSLAWHSLHQSTKLTICLRNPALPVAPTIDLCLRDLPGSLL